MLLKAEINATRQKIGEFHLCSQGPVKIAVSAREMCDDDDAGGLWRKF
jgi:hypothetical protein